MSERALAQYYDSNSGDAYMKNCFAFAAVATLCAAAFVTSITLGAFGAETKLHVLIVTGANNHDWKATTPVLVQTLEKTGQFNVDVADDPNAPVLNEADLRQYDAVLLNYNGPRWKPQREAALLNYVRSGGGLVIVHAANNPFADWQEFNEMIGVGWRKGAGHGAFHAFAVELTDPDHPITRGMPMRMEHNKDELYHNLTGPMLSNQPPAHTKYHVLARAYSEKSTGGTGKHEPMAWTATYYQGRVFHTPMGHHVTSMQDACFTAFITRGSQWAATGNVTIPLPEALATAAQ